MVTALSLVPLLAFGQTAFGTITTTVGGQSTAVIANDATTHQPDCSTVLTGTWTTALTGTPCSSLQIWVTSEADCEAAPAGTDLVLPDVPQSTFTGMPNKTGNVTFTVDQMVGAGAADGGTGACGTGVFQADFLLCAAINMDTTLFCTTKQVVQNTLASKTAAEIIYDTSPPGAPTLNSVEALDGALAVSYTVSADTDTANDFVHVQKKGPGDTDFSEAGNAVLADVSTQTIENLTDGAAYQIRVYTVDAAGNPSAFSSVLTGTPVASSGFWGAYRADGGAAQGCSAAPGAMAAALLGLLAVMWLNRRRS